MKAKAFAAVILASGLLAALSVRSPAVGDRENIYALDMKEIKVRAFDRDGKHLLTFGKKGKGPGEIDSPLRMEIREMAFISKKKKLYCMVQENEEGIPQVKRYDMIWK